MLKKIKNNIENVFIHDKGNVLKNLSPGKFQTNSTTTVTAQEGIVKENFNCHILIITHFYG